LQKPAAILFDLDGTLVDSVFDLADALNRALTDFGLPNRDINQIRSWIGNGAKTLLIRAISGKANPGTGTPAVHFLEFDDLYTAFKYYYSERVYKSSQLYPGVLETLESLRSRDIKLAVVTNKPEVLAEKLLTEAGLRSFFGVVVGGDSLAVKKPDPAPLVYACAQLSVSTDQTVMVGDSASDIGAANAINMPVLAASWGYTQGLDLTKANVTAIIRRFTEIPVLVGF
jgi:phosphoglycolate phosphatase